MPYVLLVLCQIGLLVAWYTVPTMAALSAWIIFIPLMLIGLGWLVFGGFMLIMLLIVGMASRRA